MRIDQGKLKELLTDHQTGHSEFQDDYLITWRHGGTLYGQYKQALRELYRRFRGLRDLCCDRQKCEIEIRREHEKSQGNSYEAQLAAVEYKRKLMQLEELDRSYTNTKREFVRFCQQAQQLKESIGTLNTVRRKKLDREMWVHKTKIVIALDLLSIGRLSKNTYELLGALPHEMKMPVMDFIENNDIKQIRTWYLTEGNQADFESLPSVEGIPELELENIDHADHLATI